MRLLESPHSVPLVAGAARLRQILSAFDQRRCAGAGCSRAALLLDGMIDIRGPFRSLPPPSLPVGATVTTGFRRLCRRPVAAVLSARLVGVRTLEQSGEPCPAVLFGKEGDVRQLLHCLREPVSQQQITLARRPTGLKLLDDLPELCRRWFAVADANAVVAGLGAIDPERSVVGSPMQPGEPVMNEMNSDDVPLLRPVMPVLSTQQRDHRQQARVEEIGGLTNVRVRVTVDKPPQPRTHYPTPLLFGSPGIGLRAGPLLVVWVVTTPVHNRQAVLCPPAFDLDDRIDGVVVQRANERPILGVENCCIVGHEANRNAQQRCR